MKNNNYKTGPNVSGLEVLTPDGPNDSWTVTGYPSHWFFKKRFECAHDITDFFVESGYVKETQTDSEYCQFFAHFDSEAEALDFLKKVQSHLQKVDEVVFGAGA